MDPGAARFALALGYPLQLAFRSADRVTLFLSSLTRGMLVSEPPPLDYRMLNGPTRARMTEADYYVQNPQPSKNLLPGVGSDALDLHQRLPTDAEFERKRKR